MGAAGVTSRLDELRARFSAHQAALAKDDPVSFAKLAGITPDPWQVRVLQGASRRMLLNCSRQAGKSTIASVMAAHRAIYRPGSLILLLSPSMRQSSELFRKVEEVLRRCPTAPGRVEDNRLSTELENGSRIVSLPSSEGTVRGYSAVDLLIEDEASQVPDDLYKAVRPMLATSRGQLLLMSTPKGRVGHFYEAWERGGDTWERVSIKAADVPRISAEFLAEERAQQGDAWYRQEYECEFLNAASGLVYRFDEDTNVIAKAPALAHHVLAIDYGFADETAFTVLGWREHDPCVYVVESTKGAELTPSAAAEVAHELERQYRPVRIVGDVGGLGKGYAEEARRRFALPIEPADKNNKRGYIDLFNDALREGRLKVVGPTCLQLVEEWRSLVWDERRQKEATSRPNHCADATLYGWRATAAYLNRPEDKKPKPGTPEYFAAEEKRMEDAVDEELEGDALRRSAQKPRWYRGHGIGGR